MAYNEQANIGKLLNILSTQNPNNCKIEEIVVVASGCTDKTEEIVKEFQQKDTRIKLVTQEKREGKASAINLFLSQAQGEIIILESADTLPYPNTIEELINPFILDKEIGAVGCQVVPINTSNNFLGYYTRIFWRLHHLISLSYPKCGEMLAFKNVLPSIAYDTATDETWIIALLHRMGYKIAYAKDAKVQNKGSDNLKDLLLQRRRHMIGYIHLNKKLRFKPKTLDNFYVLKLIIKELKPKLKEIPYLFGVILIEGYARLLAYYDWYIKKKNPYIWEIAKTTKELHK